MSGPAGNVEIPAGLVEEINRYFGADGRRWLDQLPGTIARMADRWNLRIDGVPRHGAHALVVPVLQGGIPRALKVAYPDESTARELAGLRAWNGHGTVALIAVIPDEGILLLERLDPQRTLATLPVIGAASELGTLTRRLAIPPPPESSFPTTAERAAEIRDALRSAWVRASRPFPEARLRRTLDLLAPLTTSGTSLMTTWDLHGDNVLWGDRAGWTMIDPMPMVGDPEITVAPFLWNRTEDLAGPADLQHALEGYVASGGLDRDRVHRWFIVRLADYWCWGLNIGLTIDPERCRTLLDWFDPLP